MPLPFILSETSPAVIEEILQDVVQVLVTTLNPNGPVSEFLNKKAVYSPSPNTSQLAARMKVRRTFRSIGEGGLKGFEEFRKIPRSFAPRSFICYRKEIAMTTAVLTREEAEQSPQPKKPQTKLPLGTEELKKLDAYWRAANYLSVGQIYLYENPLLKEPLTKEHVKPRLLGHWGTTPGLNFIYAHLNRVIKKYDLDMIYIAGPGHGGPGLVANTYLEGIYSEVYPNISQDEEGMKKLFKQFSFPGGIPSHVAPETPGSIHEGGELGYAVSHAYGAAFDNPNLIVACVVGDGEAETGPLATSWHSNKFLNPATDGVVLPILHLNGYKIANPCLLARSVTKS